MHHAAHTVLRLELGPRGGKLVDIDEPAAVDVGLVEERLRLVLRQGVRGFGPLSRERGKELGACDLALRSAAADGAARGWRPKLGGARRAGGERERAHIAIRVEKPKGVTNPLRRVGGKFAGALARERPHEHARA